MAKLVNTVTLSVLATSANVREVEPDGSVLTHVRFVGKAFSPETQSFEPVPGGQTFHVALKRDRRLGHLLDALRKGDLLPANNATAVFAGVGVK